MAGLYTVNATNLNLRSAPVIDSSNIIATLANGQVVQRLGFHSADWWKVSTVLDGQTKEGFVAQRFLSPQVVEYTVIADGLNLRSAPVVDSSNLITVLPKGQIVERQEVVVSDGWWKVSTVVSGSSVEGYVANPFLEPLQDPLEEVKNNTQFRVYHQPTEQDLEERQSRGIPPNGEDNRSERLCPIHVLSPRRQTDSLVRQLLELLQTTDIAFILAERLVQYPEDYLSIVSQFQKAVLIQSFVGIGNAAQYPNWAKERHSKELWKIEQSIRLIKSINLPIVSVACAMGDSPSSAAPGVRTSIQNRLYELLDRYDLSALRQPISWGADELVAMAMAQTLPKTKIKIRIANDDTKLHYDAQKAPSEVIAEKLPEIGLEETIDGDWSFEVAVLTRRLGGSTSAYQVNDAAQALLDQQFLAPYRSYSPDQLQKLVIVDGRLFNGAWNADSVLASCDLLAFGSWGTFGNCFGSTLATAKILFYANNEIAQKQLYLEAVAHDVFANGYKEAQRKDEPGSFADQLKRKDNIEFKHSEGYPDFDKTLKVFTLLNKHVNERMSQFFSGTGCLTGRKLQITPQFWRTFESEIHLWPMEVQEVHKVGVYRTDLNSIAFDPTSSPFA